MLRNELFIALPQKEYFSGEVVAGYAELRLPFPTKTKGVYLHFSGYETVEVNRKYERNNFVSLNMLLPGPGSKDHGRTLFGFGSVKKKAMDVPAGTHRYPFAFRLPNAIPCSFKNMFSSITYEIRIVMEAGEKNATDLMQAVTFQVGGSLFDMNFLGNNARPFNVMENKSFLLTRGTLDVNVNLDSKVFLAGDVMNVRFDIMNTSSKTSEQTKLALIQKIIYSVHGSVQREDENELAVIQLGTIAPKAELHQAHQIQIPTTAPESVNFIMIGNAKIGKCCQIHYLLKVTGIIKTATNLSMEIPITVVRRAVQQPGLPPANAPGVMGTAPPPQMMMMMMPQQQQYYLPPPPPPQQQQQQPYAPVHNAPLAPIQMQQPAGGIMYPSLYGDTASVDVGGGGGGGGTIPIDQSFMASQQQYFAASAMAVDYDAGAPQAPSAAEDTSNANTTYTGDYAAYQPKPDFSRVQQQQPHPHPHPQQQPIAPSSNYAPSYDDFYKQ